MHGFNNFAGANHAFFQQFNPGGEDPHATPPSLNYFQRFDVYLQLAATREKPLTPFEMARVPEARVGTHKGNRGRGITFTHRQNFADVRGWLRDTFFPPALGWCVDSLHLSTRGERLAVLAYVSKHEVGGGVPENKSESSSAPVIAASTANADARAVEQGQKAGTKRGEAKCDSQEKTDDPQVDVKTVKGPHGEEPQQTEEAEAKAKAPETDATTSCDVTGDGKVEGAAQDASLSSCKLPPLKITAEREPSFVRVVDVSGNAYNVFVDGFGWVPLQINTQQSVQKAKEKLQRCFEERQLEFVLPTDEELAAGRSESSCAEQASTVVEDGADVNHMEIDNNSAATPVEAVSAVGADPNAARPRRHEVSEAAVVDEEEDDDDDDVDSPSARTERSAADPHEDEDPDSRVIAGLLEPGCEELMVLQRPKNDVGSDSSESEYENRWAHLND
ncbi:unnamed protein product [Amoebophrya sp. A120]|nr:unnamed protein product [Amoebophrya sp. A120]|eukprot:GSA120T00018636001.1